MECFKDYQKLLSGYEFYLLSPRELKELVQTLKWEYFVHPNDMISSQNLHNFFSSENLQPAWEDLQAWCRDPNYKMTLSKLSPRGCLLLLDVLAARGPKSLGFSQIPVESARFLPDFIPQLFSYLLKEENYQGVPFMGRGSMACPSLPLRRFATIESVQTLERPSYDDLAVFKYLHDEDLEIADVFCESLPYILPQLSNLSPIDMSEKELVLIPLWMRILDSEGVTYDPKRNHSILGWPE